MIKLIKNIIATVWFYVALAFMIWIIGWNCLPAMLDNQSAGEDYWKEDEHGSQSEPER